MASPALLYSHIDFDELMTLIRANDFTKFKNNTFHLFKDSIISCIVYDTARVVFSNDDIQFLGITDNSFYVDYLVESLNVTDRVMIRVLARSLKDCFKGLVTVNDEDKFIWVYSYDFENAIDKYIEWSIKYNIDHKPIIIGEFFRYSCVWNVERRGTLRDSVELDSSESDDLPFKDILWDNPPDKVIKEALELLKD